MGNIAALRLNMALTMVLVFGVLAVLLVALMIILNMPIIWVFLITILFILFQWVISPLIVTHAAHLRYLKKGENAWLEKTITDISEKAGIKPPRVAISPDKTPNAFVFGRTRGSATLAVHQGLLEQLNQSEIRGVIAHEVGHLKHRDCMVMTLLSAVPLLAYLVARLLFHGERFAPRGRDRGNAALAILAAAVISWVVYMLAQLLVRWLSRMREYYADSFSAFVTGDPRSLESGLTRIAYGLSLSKEESSGLRAFYIGDPALARVEAAEIVRNKSKYDLDNDGILDEAELMKAMEEEAERVSTWGRINRAFATHPPTYKRILLLRRIEEEMKGGSANLREVYRRI